MQVHQPRLLGFHTRMPSDGGPVSDVLDLTADLLYARWRRAVDLLWREAVRRRQASLGDRESARSARRIKNLQRIVRKALADYHRIELERQRRAEEATLAGSRSHRRGG
jgi:hypothetical protein